MNIWQYLALFVSVILGGLLAFYVQRFSRRWLQVILSFSGAYILGITVLHLLPGVIAGEEVDERIGIWLLGGFFIQLLLEQLSGGVEHGHMHAAKGPSARFALAVMAGLCLHAFMEGMPLAGYQQLHALHHSGHSHGHQHLLIGIILHKAPAAFALVTLLLTSGFSRWVTMSCLVVFASMSPLGSAFASLPFWSAEAQHYLLALVIGSFLHISTTILFETDSSHRHRVSHRKLLAILAGLGMALGTLYF